MVKIISLKQNQYGFSGWSTDIFDGTAVTLWVISMWLLFFMALTFFKRAHMIEFIGVFLDQPMPRNVAQPFVALTLGMALALTLMVKSTLISHLVKPIPWKGPDRLEELVTQTPEVKLLVKSTTTLAKIIESPFLLFFAALESLISKSLSVSDHCPFASRDFLLAARKR